MTTRSRPFHAQPTGVNRDRLGRFGRAVIAMSRRLPVRPLAAGASPVAKLRERP